MSLFSSALYRRSPRRFQEWLISLRAFSRNSLREGKRFEAELHDVLRAQSLSADELLRYQYDRMLALVRHAAEHVPYYKDLFRRKRISVDDFKTLEDFKALPLMSKEDVVKAGRSLLATNHRGMKFKGATSGTTGLSMIGFRDLNMVIRENAFMWRQMLWAGFKRGQRRAWIRGDMIVPATQASPPFWRLNHADNMLMMSSFHLSDANADAYIRMLEQFDPVLIQAYPSSIAFLARHLDSRRRVYRGASLKAVLTSSETLYDEQRQIIERAMRCRVFDRYGCFERVTSIDTCERGNYHISSDYGLVELIPQDDGSAEIVGTGFDNFLMPLLRYRTGDSVIPMEPDPNPDCSCGSSFPRIKRILGRIDDSIKTPDGRQIGMMVNMFDGLDNLWAGQVVQDSLDTIKVRVVPIRPLDDGARDNLVARARSLVGPDMNVEIDVVHDIPRTRNGKFRAVVCNI